MRYLSAREKLLRMLYGIILKMRSFRNRFPIFLFLAIFLLTSVIMPPASVQAVGATTLTGTCHKGNNPWVELHWQPVAGATVNAVQRGWDPNADPYWQPLFGDDQPFSVYSFTDNDLQEGRVYEYRVKTDNQVASNTFKCNTTQNPSTAPDASTGSAQSVGQTTATLTGSATPNGAGTNAWFEYGTTESLGSQTASAAIGRGQSPVPQTASLTNLSPSTIYFFRIVAQNNHGTTQGSTQAFTTAAPPSSAPTATTGGAQRIGQSSATLTGSVNPGGTATTAWFEYGSTASLGSETSHVSAGSGSSDVSQNQAVSGLTAATTYFFRMVAQNSNGTVRGTTQTFTTSDVPVIIPTATAPSATTNSAQAVGQNSANLTGSVNPHNASTNAWFEYGTSASLGAETSHTTLVAGSSDVSQNVSIGGLAPGTKYYYRMAAQNSVGSSQGSVLSFTTSAGSPPPPPPPPPTPQSPTVHISANGVESSISVAYGTSVRISWTSANTSACQITPLNEVGTSGAFSTDPLRQSVTFTATCAGSSSSGGTATQSVVVNVGLAPLPPKPTGSKPSVVTLDVSESGKTFMVLPATVHPGGAATTAWFEYGTTDAFGTSTAKTGISSQAGATVVTAQIDAKSGTEYFYRIVAQNSFGISRGATKSVVAAGDPTFRIEPDSKTVRINETAQFHAYYDVDGDGSAPADDVTRGTVWVVATPDVAESDNGGTFSGKGWGATIVNAYYGGPGVQTRVDDPNVLKAQGHIVVSESNEPDFVADTSTASGTAAGSSGSGLAGWLKWLLFLLFLAAVGVGIYYLLIFLRRRRDEESAHDDGGWGGDAPGDHGASARGDHLPEVQVRANPLASFPHVRENAAPSAAASMPVTHAEAAAPATAVPVGKTEEHHSEIHI
jgi:phosphodiesterase/alkaline phosphatase D-like protein